MLALPKTLESFCPKAGYYNEGVEQDLEASKSRKKWCWDSFRFRSYDSARFLA